jgi:ActR/RegA family two-component response regulator
MAARTVVQESVTLPCEFYRDNVAESLELFDELGQTGIEMLQEARQDGPSAELLFLTAYADTDVAIKAINDVGLDYCGSPAWRLHR